MKESKYKTINTTWVASASQGTGALKYTTVDSGMGHAQGTPTDFSIKGMCYSPAPIGESNKMGPNIGDWFWDSFTVTGGTTIWNWSRYWSTNSNDQTYRADLDKIKALGVNTVRVYCMLPYQMNKGGSIFLTQTEFTHADFLDACYERGLFVLVGFPFPAPYFLKGGSCVPPAAAWLDNYTTLLKSLSSHPAVMGFTMLNEIDGAGQSYVDPNEPAKDAEQVEYYWKTIQDLALVAKRNAPGKLIGQAFHDMPIQWTRANAPYFNLAKDVDFWGVNTYQTKSLSSLFDPVPNIKALGFNGLEAITADFPNVYKPVILTEIGWPATGHDSSNNIYYDQSTGEKTAKTIKLVCPQVYSQPLCLGMFYFEFCDEWWAQPSPPIYEWNGGMPDEGMPNGFTDLEGFGLYQTAKNPKIPNKPENSSWPINWNDKGNGPYPYTDPITERTPLTTALKTVFSQ